MPFCPVWTNITSKSPKEISPFTLALLINTSAKVSKMTFFQFIITDKKTQINNTILYLIIFMHYMLLFCEITIKKRLFMLVQSYILTEITLFFFSPAAGSRLLAITDKLNQIVCWYTWCSAALFKLIACYRCIDQTSDKMQLSLGSKSFLSIFIQHSLM